MKLNFRDLKQQKFTIDAEPSDTIAEVKEKIASEKGWEAPTQKLIYSGKILADANTVESYKIEEKGFIVCMVSKPKAAPVATSSASTAPPPATPAQPVSTPAQPPAPQPNPAAAPANPPQTPTPAQPQTATAGAEGGGFNDPSAMFMGDRREETIREMENMGFARPEIERALRAAFFNPDRAIEYLLSGIPENVQPPQRQAAPAANPPAGQTATSPPAAPAAPAAGGEANPDEPVNLFEAAAAAAGGQGGGARGAGRGAGAGAVAGAGAGAGAGLGAGIGAGLGAAAAGAGGQGGAVNMDFLRQSPHFQHLRQLVQQQPAMLEPILQQVAEGNPQLAQLIGQNEQQFLQLLSEDVGGEGIGGMGETGPLPPGATPISVTEEERDAIERLCRLGFSRDQVIQAYFACDKNEELAANFLFEQPDDDDQQPGA